MCIRDSIHSIAKTRVGHLGVMTNLSSDFLANTEDPSSPSSSSPVEFGMVRKLQNVLFIKCTLYFSLFIREILVIFMFFFETFFRSNIR